MLALRGSGGSNGLVEGCGQRALSRTRKIIKKPSVFDFFQKRETGVRVLRSVASFFVECLSEFAYFASKIGFDQAGPKVFPRQPPKRPFGFPLAPLGLPLASLWTTLASVGLPLAPLWTTLASIWLSMELPRLPMGFHCVSKEPKWLPRCPQGILEVPKASPASLWYTRVSVLPPMELPRGPKGFPSGFQRISREN